MHMFRLLADILVQMILGLLPRKVVPRSLGALPGSRSDPPGWCANIFVQLVRGLLCRMVGFMRDSSASFLKSFWHAKAARPALRPGPALAAPSPHCRKRNGGSLNISIPTRDIVPLGLLLAILAIRHLRMAAFAARTSAAAGAAEWGPARAAVPFWNNLRPCP